MPLTEMPRLGGGATFLSFALGIILILLIVVGFVLAAGKRRLTA